MCLCVGMQVGHTLGLRHNFRGSTYFTHEELGDPEFMNSTERHGTAAGAITSSIMDCKLSSWTIYSATHTLSLHPIATDCCLETCSWHRSSPSALSDFRYRNGSSSS